MSSGITYIDWTLVGIAAFLVLLAIYAHLEGNRLTATRFVFNDIRRDMTRRPAHKVWWRAFSIAMGWRKRGHIHSSRHHARHSNVTFISEGRSRQA